MGAFDFPAVVDFVLNKTGHAKLDVVGYSLGATIAIAGMSEKPAYNKKIDKLVLMAPTTRMAAYKFPVNLFHRFSFMFKVQCSTNHRRTQKKKKKDCIYYN